MGRSQESFNKKEVKNKKDKKRKEKEKKKLARKDTEKKSGLEDNFAYGMLTSTPPDPKRKLEVKLEDIEISIPKRDATEKADPVRKGVVTFFNDAKGFGFIRDMETQASVFVHANNLLEEIKENNMVTFEVVPGQKGPTATQVKLYKKKEEVKAATEIKTDEPKPETTEE
jgi:cold shock CspA family protein